MKKFSFLGHDNASLSMILNDLYDIYENQFMVETVRIVSAKRMSQISIPFKIEGIDIEEHLHSEWKRKEGYEFIIGTMVAKIKQTVATFFHDNYNIDFNDYKTIINPSSNIAKESKIKDGVIIGPGAIVAPFASIGNLASLNRNSTVGHHSVINDFATLNPGCNIAGFCNIGRGVTIGMGANVIDGKVIGANTIIGAGSLVTKDIPPNVVAYGVPAKIIREKTKKK